MKIKKINLTEADEIKVIDPQKDSTEEIADQVETSIETATNKEVSADKVDTIADEIKDAGETLNADSAVVVPTKELPLEIKNALTEALDEALISARYFRKEHISEVPNVLICGLPGSSKTASVYNWANGKVNITYVNAKNNDLDAFINGYTVQDPNDMLTVTQAVSKNLNGLDRPMSVLFLDEYNRQTKKDVRASLLTLINEHYVTGKEIGGKHYFDNFLFTIAAINPPVGMEDEGADDLNDAEKSRFLYSVEFDSDAATTNNYIHQLFGGRAKRLAKMKDVSKEDVWEPRQEVTVDKDANPLEYTPEERIERLLRIEDLGDFITMHDDFAYDTKEDLSALFNQQKKMLNQRSLTAALAASQGDVDKFKYWLQKYSNFLDKNIKNLLDILSEYVVPTKEALFARAGLDGTQDLASVLNDEESESAIDQEDDKDLFTNNGNTSGVAIPTVQEVDNTIRNTIMSW